MSEIRFVIITGLSGAGKTVALHSMEDMGYFCIDNLPPALMPRFAGLLAAPENYVDQVALVIDIRGGGFFEKAAEAINEMETEGDSTTLFLEATDEELVQRFKETRRRHPLAGQGSVLEALQRERESLLPLREQADHVIDTTDLRPADLRARLFSLFGGGEETKRLFISVISFGFKNGLPRDADLVFDVRFLPNPHYVEDLRPMTGLNAEVEEYVWSAPLTQEFFSRMVDLLTFLLPQYQNEGKSQLTIAIGCTGGRHRSVVLARQLGLHLREGGYPVVIEHRDLDPSGGEWPDREIEDGHPGRTGDAEGEKDG